MVVDQVAIYLTDVRNNTNEHTCTSRQTWTFFLVILLECSEGAFSCSGSDICLTADQQCDGSEDCPLADDEDNCGEISLFVYKIYD